MTSSHSDSDVSNAPPAKGASSADLERELDDTLSGDHPATADDVFHQFCDTIAARLPNAGPPANYQLISTAFNIGGIVPRAEPYKGPMKSEDIFIRLENKVYGPLDRKHLNELLGSGLLTGYESATVDFVRWTPLAYHPRMVLADSVDPDMTHDILSGMSDLPASSGKSGIAMAEAFLKEEPAPLAAIINRPKKKPKADLPLPIVGDLDKESMEDVARRLSGAHDPIKSDSVPRSPKATPVLPVTAAPEIPALEPAAEPDATPALDAEPSPFAAAMNSAPSVPAESGVAAKAAIIVALLIGVLAIVYFAFLR